MTTRLARFSYLVLCAGFLTACGGSGTTTLNDIAGSPAPAGDQSGSSASSGDQSGGSSSSGNQSGGSTSSGSQSGGSSSSGNQSGSSAPSGSASGSATPTTFTIGGTVSGLAAGESVVLDINGGNPLTVAAGGSFTFPSGIAVNDTYAVTVSTSPLGQTCTVAGGSGTVTSANIANIVVTCSDQAFSLGGTIQGLNGSGLVLANGTDTLTVVSGATSFTLPSAVAYTSSYAVTVKTQPVGLTCTVTGGSGTMPANAVNSVSVSCTDQPFALGGTVSGLGSNTGLVLANGSATLSVPANATQFTLPTPVSFGSPYAVSVQSAPAGLTCTIGNGSGTMPANNVTNIAVTCADRAFTIGGSVGGLTASGLVLANGSDTLAVAANASSFTMPTPVAYTSSYNLVVQAAPAATTCTIVNGSGTMGAANVTNISVTCAPTPTYTIGGTIGGLGSSSGLTLANGSDTLSVLANATNFTMPTGVASGATYDVMVKTHPPIKSCAVTNGSGTVSGANVTNVAVACAAGIESVVYSFAGAPTDADHPYYEHLVLGTDGNFYGLTEAGSVGSTNKGTVFKVTPQGVETVLWSFGNVTNDGQNPYGSLVQGTDGNFYGMTEAGGAYTAGTVFKITPTGTETVLWSFGNGNDGQDPYGNLIQATDGNFYGMTYQGGTYGAGTVFKITPTGTETVLWSFGANGDGRFPTGSLVQGSDGNFYGMTTQGGQHNNRGTVFTITPTGTETVLWSFGSGIDGYDGHGSLIQATDGNFYGMTTAGGQYGEGTVFRITPTGFEAVVYSFANTGTDGESPWGSLVQGSDGNLYGMTNLGGAHSGGTIFQVTLGGTETVLWSFGAGTDGKYPYGDLIFGPDGTLYGLTWAGGTNGTGAVIEFN